MSQASDQMLWCLKKAERELAECQREGKPARHRGLIAGQPNRMLAQGHLRKAEHNLEAMLHNAKGGFTDWAVTAGFYAAYHCMLAILAAFGFESRNQTCTLAAIEALQEQGRIALDHRHIGMLRTGGRVIEMREAYTYGMQCEASQDEVAALRRTCLDILKSARGIVWSTLSR
ncbi:HEPN domain-containing protein [Candidatus Woesearchaeota archaeon]|nr:HEPN domain-containing protein [Candidatus Woesearchaeota archaeon]